MKQTLLAVMTRHGLAATGRIASLCFSANFPSETGWVGCLQKVGANEFSSSL